MTLLHLTPAISALLLLTAHFYRSGSMLTMLICVIVMSALTIRRPWAARTVQFALILGAVEWLRTTIYLVVERIQSGTPYLRLAVILGTVMLMTALATLVFRSARVKAHFRIAADLDA